MDSSGYMDPRIWSRLPGHILEHVLSFLPLKTFLNLRSTCKQFNSMLFSPTFMSKHATSSSSSPFASFILLSHPHFLKTCSLFNTVVNSWCDMSLPFPRKLSCLSSSALLASSNGLLCFSIPQSSGFIVCNLLRRSIRRVKFPLCQFDFEFLTLVSRPNGYKLFMLSSEGSSSSALVYDSKLGSWKRFAGCNSTLNENYHQKGVYYNGYLFFTTPYPFQVVCFHMETGQWERSMVGLPASLTFIRLVSDEDQKLYLIGGVGPSGISRSIKVWELREDGQHWVEVEAMPGLRYSTTRCPGKPGIGSPSALHCLTNGSVVSSGFPSSQRSMPRKHIKIDADSMHLCAQNRIGSSLLFQMWQFDRDRRRRRRLCRR